MGHNGQMLLLPLADKDTSLKVWSFLRTCASLSFSAVPAPLSLGFNKTSLCHLVMKYVWASSQ